MTVEFNLRGKHTVPAAASPRKQKKRRVEEASSSVAESSLASSLSCSEVLDLSDSESKTSPSKRGSKRKFRPQPSTKVKKLRPTSAKEERHSKLCEFFGLDPKIPLSSEKQAEIKELQKQVLVIKRYVDRYLKDEPQEHLKGKIQEICRSQESHTEKMAQLGMLFYFIETENKLPHVYDVDFISMAAQELLDKIKFLKTRYSSVFDEKIASLPSGTMHALLNTLTRMVITREQKVNVGALHAILDMLDKTPLISHFKPEHYEHLVVVFKKLLSSPEAIALLEQNLSAPPPMALLIRLDLKLAIDADVGSVEIARACLMALLFDIRQYPYDQNCYALGVLEIASEQTIDQTLSQLMSLLSTGSLTLLNEETLFLLPFVERRLICESDFETFVTAKEMRSLTILKKLFSALHIDNSELPSFEGEEVFADALYNFLTEQQQEENFNLAQLFLQTYASNSLLTLFLMATEFKNANFKDVKLESREASSKKTKIINRLMTPFTQGGSTPFTEALRKKMESAFWIESHSERDLTFNGEDIEVKSANYVHFVQLVEEDQEILEKALRESSKLVFLWKGEMKFVHSISFLQQFIEVLAREAAIETGEDQTSLSSVQALIHSPAFQKEIAQMCADSLAKRKTVIDPAILQRCDLVVLGQCGGYGGYLLKNLFQMPLRRKRVESTSPTDFLEKLRQSLRQMSRETLNNNHLLLVESEKHVFTLSPERCHTLRNAKDFNRLMQRAVYERAQKLLESPIPKTVKGEILKRVAPNQERQRALYPLFASKHFVTYRQFRDQVAASSELTLQEKVRFLKAVGREYNKTTLSKENLEVLLNALVIDLKPEELEAIWNDFKVKHPGRRKPYILAGTLNRLLFKHLRTNTDPYLIEEVLCRTQKLPLAFDIGDLNYPEQHTERPHHKRLMVAYHFSSDEMTFFSRGKKREVVEDPDEYFSFKIFYKPKQS